MDRYLLPSYVLTSVAHWEAMADVLGEVETERLYGPRPEYVNTASSVEGLYFDRKAPRRSVYVACLLACVAAGSLLWGATHHRASTQIEPCALVLTRESGPECR